MLLDKKLLLYELFLILDHVLMLVLCSLYERHKFFIVACTHELAVSINLHFFFLVKMANQNVNHAIFQDI